MASKWAVDCDLVGHTEKHVYKCFLSSKQAELQAEPIERSSVTHRVKRIKATHKYQVVL